MLSTRAPGGWARSTRGTTERDEQTEREDREKGEGEQSERVRKRQADKQNYARLKVKNTPWTRKVVRRSLFEFFLMAEFASLCTRVC